MGKKSLIDIFINLLGFIPLGFILATFFRNISGVHQSKTIFISVLICFFTSLFIEITQAWIPIRSSQSLDLILNTAGGYLGALVSIKFIGSWLEYIRIEN